MIANTPVVHAKIVCPSGGAFAVSSAAIALPAPGPVLHHDLLADVLPHLLRDQPRDDVGRAAGREPDQEAHRLRRPGLRRRPARRRRSR